MNPSHFPSSASAVELVDQPASGLPGLSVVELEVCSRCNRSCSYCPVSLNPRPPVPARMSADVFDTTIAQLAEVSFAGRISYHLYNEPLLRTDLPRLIAKVAERLPDALQLLLTNGDLLDDRRYEALRAAGVDYFYVTRHVDGEYPARPFQIVQNFRGLTLTNRGGTVTEVPLPSPLARSTPCFAPSEMLIVTVNGDVLLCYEDANRSQVLGNILTTSLTDIWMAPENVEHREELAAGERERAEICRRCSNTSHSAPGLSALEDFVLNASGLSREDDPVRTLKQRSTDGRPIGPPDGDGR
ncbi:hypothetical protein GCM10029976_032720 [Kribbella albertanoniae]|uniref:Radical SAM protein n=1 Tax=Kribbella albertanoniae TaxID=1266829 RepID=A0A4R4QIK1_9ACTN|nr:radical SAM/SPASM domain-containing protein [Kribbella albertanoniae]TDC35508.1 radical SAM protein [Kribbella albertanoniae]